MKTTARTTPENITSLSGNDIFVFGSNLSGIHGGGAARTARKWGAEWGNAVGRQGQTYAIPTKAEAIVRTLTVAEINLFVVAFIAYAKSNIELNFLVTEIGCGLAGLAPEQIAPLFKSTIEIENIHLPKRFWEILTK